jgi:hypothetical protein
VGKKQISFGNDNKKEGATAESYEMTIKKATATVRHLARAFSPLRVRRLGTWGVAPGLA